MIYNNISIKTVLNQVSTIVKDGYKGWQADAVEWSGDALEHIGYYTAFSTFTKEIEVNNHRAVIPNDLFLINGVFYDDAPLPYGAKTVNSEYFSKVYFQSMPQGLELQEVNENLGEISVGTIPATIKQVSPDKYSGDYYFIQPGYIITSFESGTITLIYTAFDKDEEGLPKIPDEINTRTAIMWYIISNLILTGYQHPSIDYKFAYQMWEKYLTQAQNTIAFPSPEKFKTFIKRWVTMASGLDKSFDNTVNFKRGDV